MALAKIEKQMAANGQGCLGKAADDEPVFILRAKDRLAPDAVEHWIRLVEQAAHQAGASNPRRDSLKLKEAQALAHQMRAWQASNGCKVPD
jgi:hypothetical protein